MTLGVCSDLSPLNALEIGSGAADSQVDLIEYVQRLLWGEHCGNGQQLDRQGGLSLERIVFDRLPGLFGESDREQAKRTLGI